MIYNYIDSVIYHYTHICIWYSMIYPIIRMLIVMVIIIVSQGSRVTSNGYYYQ